ncbi:Maf family protein, partial [Candidatus Gottesmanbacteria bacterium]|nr:Maf family protein [Candidatus Gottesmanbacteria bacterium]
MKIILASSSIGRKKVLKSLGLKFRVIPANIDEEKITASNHIKLVKKIAKAKA